MQENSTFFKRGYDLMLQERYKEAIPYFEEDVKQNTKRLLGQYYIGLCQMYLGIETGSKILLASAIQYLTKANALNTLPNTEENLWKAIEELEKLK